MGQFTQQFWALLKRNFWLKKRTPSQTFHEFLWPIYFILILAMVRGLTIKDINTSARPAGPVEALPRSLPPLTRIFYAPNDSYTTLFAQVFLRSAFAQWSPNSTFALQPFASLEEAEAVYTDLAKTNHHYGVFGGIGIDLPGGSFTVRTISEQSTSTRAFKAPESECRPGTTACEPRKYRDNGFLVMQSAIMSAYFKVMNYTFPAELTMQSMDKDSFIPDASFIRNFAAIYYVYAYSFFIQFLVINLVNEKEKKQKEWLRIMGVHDMAFWLSWSVLYFALILLISLIALLCAYLTTFFNPARSDLGIFLLILLLYGTSIINLAFVITPFFSQVKRASPVATLSTVLISLLFFAVTLTSTVDEQGESHSAIPVPGQWLLCLLSPVAMALAVDKCLYLDISKSGLTWANSGLGEFPLWGMILMLFIDTVLYFFLALWLDNVVPGEYGQRRPLLFFLMPSYWRRQPRSDEEMEKLIKLNERKRSKEQLANIEEMLPEWEEHKKLRISNLVKTFKSDGKSTNAVNGVSLDIYEGQITAILGHNGAGKTTMLNMLTGLVQPTDGAASIYGLQVTDSSDMRHIRSMTGVCPQQNVLFDVLSVREHFELFGAIKGISPSTLKTQINRLVDEVGLTDQMDTFARDLSGGQKRKLCVGVALLGNPKLVFLDEPSAGMDPNARRHLWSLLRENKKGRIILLITHFMDEADILADRKAILTKGQLKCCGSSLYLKSNFGIGYHLSLSVDTSRYQKEAVEDLITSTVEGSELTRAHGMEVKYTLPYLQVSQFSALFAKLEAPTANSKSTAEELGITTFGISMTTLEEVFLKLEEEEEGMTEERELASQSELLTNGNARKANQPASQSGLTEAISLSAHQLISDEHLAKQKFATLLWLRVLIILRGSVSFMLRLGFPVVLVIGSLALVRFTAAPSTSAFPPLELTPSPAFGGVVDPVTLMNSTGNPLPSWESANISTNGEVNWLANGTDFLSLTKLPQYALQVNEFLHTNVSQTNLNIVYNDLWTHGLPVALDQLASILLQFNTGNSSARFVTIAHPWRPVKPSLKWNGALFGGSIMLGMVFVFIASSFAADVVKDRECKARSQLRLAGVTSKLYWGSIVLVDYTQALLMTALILLLILAFGIPSLSASAPMACITIFFLLNIPFYMLLAYTLSFAFDKYETCTASLPSLFSLINILPFMAVSILQAVPDARSAAETMHYVFAFCNPLYSASTIFFQLNKVFIIEQQKQNVENPTIPFDEYLTWDSAIYPMFIAPLYFIPITLCVAALAEVKKEGGSIYDLFGKKAAAVTANTTTIAGEDSDVAHERRVVAGDSYGVTAQPPVLRVHEVQKVFKRRVTSKSKAKKKTKVAVRNAAFQVTPGEVFGLLGPNGAGKSTLLNMLTAEMAPDAGWIEVCGQRVQSNQSKMLHNIGYCPQFDALWETIKLEEHIEIYSKLQGIQPKEISKLAQMYIDALKVNEHRGKRAKDLSGGTKRKLSFIMSLLGVPKVILLDEPSTGMDPQSKHVFWDTISSSFEGTDKGAILTTHYMDEADALCSRIGIMINGALECLGTSQHLKTKFGSGYILEAKIHCGTDMATGSMEAKMSAFEAFLKDHFPGVAAMEKFGERATFKIPSASVSSLSAAFAALEQGKDLHNISEYSFSQSTLEQIFLEFAKQQVDEADDEKALIEGRDRLHRLLSVNLQSSPRSPAVMSSASSADNAAFITDEPTVLGFVDEFSRLPQEEDEPEAPAQPSQPSAVLPPRGPLDSHPSAAALLPNIGQTSVVAENSGDSDMPVLPKGSDAELSDVSFSDAPNSPSEVTTKL